MMKHLIRRAVAVLLALCLCVGLMPMALADEDSSLVGKIDVTTTSKLSNEHYTVLYQTATRMLDAVAMMCAVNKDDWDDQLSHFRYVCTLTDELTKHLEKHLEPERFLPDYSFLSTKMGDVEVFINTKRPYLKDGSVKLEYRLNPELKDIFHKATVQEVKEGLTGTLMTMKLDPDYPAIVSYADMYGIGELHSYATITCYKDNSEAIPFYDTREVLLAKGETTLKLDWLNVADPRDVGVDYLLDVDKHDPFFRGYPDGSFRPNGSITRAEVAVALYRRFIDPADSGIDMALLEGELGLTFQPDVKFPDVEPTAWYGPAIYKLASLGILKGYADGTFRPNQYISRAEFAAIMTRFAKPAPTSIYQPDFDDVPKSHYAYRNIMTARAYGWLCGVGNNIYSPNRNITRAEACKALCMMLGRRGDREAVDNGYGRQYTDLTDAHWGYYYIIEASTEHDYEFDGNMEHWSIAP